jgi:hypothetical protein
MSKLKNRMAYGAIRDFAIGKLALRARNLTEPVIVSSISDTCPISLNDSMLCTSYNRE